MEQILLHKHIVFGGEHYNPLGVIRSLGEFGIKPVYIVMDSKLKFASKSKYIHKVHVVSSIEEGYKLLLDVYGNEKNKPFLYSTDDSFEGYIDERYDELKDRFYFFNAGKSGRVNEFMNKEAIGNLAVKHGLNFLKTWRVKVGVIPEDIEYPVITKAVDSKSFGWKSLVHICKDQEELKDAFSKINATEILLQKYIQKKNEYCLDGMSVNKGKNLYISIASTYNYLLADSYSPYMTITNFNRNDILGGLKGMFEEIGFERIYSVEFLVDSNDQLYFGEINFRNSTWSYASTRAGMNLPVLWAKGMIGEDYGDIKKIKEGFTAMVEFADFNNRVREQKLSFSKWYKDYKKADCRFYVGKNDIKPMFGMIRPILGMIYHIFVK